MAEKIIYDLELHERLKLGTGNDVIIRVPGGWLYISHWGPNTVSNFVPFSNEFTPPNIAARALLKRAEEKRLAQEQAMKNPAEGTDWTDMP